jgi:hypothetical protein
MQEHFYDEPFDEDRLINMNDDIDRRFWCRQFNCTEQLLRDAIQRVGATAQNVKRHLGVR